MDSEREAKVVYHLRRAAAKLGLAQTLTDSRQVQRVAEQGVAEEEAA